MMRILTLLMLAAALAGCDGDAAPPDAPALPSVAPQTAVAAPADEMMLAELPATVVQPPGARVAVAPAFAGLVQSVAVQPGQAVRRGQLLATLVSREALETAGDLARAEARRQMTRAEAERMATLAREGVVAGARADGAAAADAEAAIDAREARRLLARAGADGDGMVKLVAPIDGRVASMMVEAGTPLDGSTAAFVIEADGSSSLALQLPERLAGQVRPGMAIVTADGQRGRLETVASAIDPATRAFAARARLSDKGAPLVSGRLVTVKLMAAAADGAVRVPLAALVQTDAGDLVFVKTKDGFAARTVRRVGDGDPAVIAAGLKAGETVAVSNLPELRLAADR
jgi:cobalt-zinc-cadmium efflux system membrane fusion protein